MVGKKENVQRIVDFVKEMTGVFEDIVRQLRSGDFSCFDKVCEELHNDITCGDNYGCGYFKWSSLSSREFISFGIIIMEFGVFINE